MPFCPKCGTEHLPGAKFCQSCGTNLTLQVEPAATQPYQHQANQHQANQQYQANPGNNYEKLVAPAYKYKRYPKASLGNRFIASFLDGLITMGLAIPAIIFLILGISGFDSYGNRRDMAPLYIFLGIVFILVPVIYGFVKDGLGQGQSWGKKPMNLMVVNLETNTPCTKSKSAIRHLISALTGAIPFVGWLIEPIMVLATDDGRKLGDKAANTQVIEVSAFTAEIEFDSI